ncbi:MAG: 50S ribosomal protein L22 [Candidatus Micrarchaeota archaeon]
MSIYKYSFKLSGDAAKKSALAQFHDVDASYKDLTQVLGAIKGKRVAEANKILDDAIALRKAIPYRKFNKGMGHRSSLGGQKGRYPKKECTLVKALLRNAVANATHKGLDEKRLFVKQAAAFKQNSFPRYRKFWASSVTLGYGKRAVWANYETARAEISVEERAFKEKKKTEKATEKRTEPEKEKRKEPEKGKVNETEKEAGKENQGKRPEKPVEKTELTEPKKSEAADSVNAQKT